MLSMHILLYQLVNPVLFIPFLPCVVAAPCTFLLVIIVSDEVSAALSRALESRLFLANLLLEDRHYPGNMHRNLMCLRTCQVQ